MTYISWFVSCDYLSWHLPVFLLHYISWWIGYIYSYSGLSLLVKVHSLRRLATCTVWFLYWSVKLHGVLCFWWHARDTPLQNDTACVFMYTVVRYKLACSYTTQANLIPMQPQLCIINNLSMYAAMQSYKLILTMYALSCVFTHTCICHTLFRLSMTALEVSSRSTTSMWLFCTATWRAPSSWNCTCTISNIILIYTPCKCKPQFDQSVSPCTFNSIIISREDLLKH